MIDFKKHSKLGYDDTKVTTTFESDKGVTVVTVSRVAPTLGREEQQLRVFLCSGFTLTDVEPILIDYGINFRNLGNSWIIDEKSEFDTILFTRVFTFGG